MPIQYAVFKKYIDFAEEIGVNNVVHTHPKVVHAIKDQADAFIHTCFHTAMYDSYVELAEKLNDLSLGDNKRGTGDRAFNT